VKKGMFDVLLYFASDGSGRTETRDGDRHCLQSSCLLDLPSRADIFIPELDCFMWCS